MIKVMIVDDEPLQRQYIRMILEEFSNSYKIGRADNGEEAIELAAQYKPDIVFLDIRMPGLDGIGSCQRAQGFPAGSADCHRQRLWRNSTMPNRPSALVWRNIS